jgi:hypothetical protein
MSVPNELRAALQLGRRFSLCLFAKESAFLLNLLPQYLLLLFNALFRLRSCLPALRGERWSVGQYKARIRRKWKERGVPSHLSRSLNKPAFVFIVLQP